METLTAAIGHAVVAGSVVRPVQRITRADLNAIDATGKLPAGQADGEAFYRVVDAA